MIIKIKALSVNKAWKGKRFKTPEYKAYEEELLLILPRLKVPNKTKLRLTIIVGFSNKGSDLSNMLKLFEDILQKKYGFDDKMNYEIFMKKEIVTKNNEFIDFGIYDIDNNIKICDQFQQN